MTLPTLTAPSFFLEIPSTKEKIKFRPFLVKEEKILLFALQDGKEETIIQAIKDIISNCTFNAIDIDNLTSWDVEYIFLQIRIKSKGSEIDLTFRCENEIEPDKVCNNIVDITVDLETVTVSNSDISKKIIISDEDNISIVMKLPTFSSILSNSNDDIFKLLQSYIDYITMGETIYDEFTQDELTAFIDSLSDAQFNKIKAFFESLPKLTKTIDIVCPKCGHKDAIVMEGLQSFLD